MLVASVLGREVRAGESWLYLDVGAYNGLIETQADEQQVALPALELARATTRRRRTTPFTVTGPTCDSSDTIFYRRAAARRTIDVGDHLYIGSTGAYTLSYASSFNGFPPPERALRR